MTVDCAREQDRPSGDTDAKLTVPANPFRETIVTADVSVPIPATGGAEEMLMSGGGEKGNVAVAVWVREPLVPVIVTL
jgi:hypothetical protein